MDYQEGYNDGIAGAGMQDRDCDYFGRSDYHRGFTNGSLDRKAMLANRVIEYGTPEYKLLEDI